MKLTRRVIKSKRLSQQKKDEKKEKNYIGVAMGSGLMLLLINGIWPESIPITSRSVWTVHGHLSEWLSISTPLFVWGFLVTLVLSLSHRMSWRERQVHAGHKLVLGLIVSIWAGVVEEVCFRWLIFLPAIATTKLSNWFFFGWAGFGISEWFHLNVWGPIADYTTGGYLHGDLFHVDSFAVGAALLYTNAMFRDGHKYLGIIGVLNSWFLGMFFFYLMLNYGLLSAILVHFAYDAIVFSTAALVHSWRNDL